jgi:hypothetical protein
LPVLMVMIHAREGEFSLINRFPNSGDWLEHVQVTVN